MNGKRFKGEPYSIYKLRMKEGEKRTGLKMLGHIFWPGSSGTLKYADKKKSSNPE
jgi:hypothetical protein